MGLYGGRCRTYLGMQGRSSPVREIYISYPFFKCPNLPAAAELI